MVIFCRAFLPKVYIPFTLPILPLPAWMCSCRVSFCLYLLVSVSLTDLNVDTRYEEREEETGQPTRPAVPDGCIWDTLLPLGHLRTASWARVLAELVNMGTWHSELCRNV